MIQTKRGQTLPEIGSTTQKMYTRIIENVGPEACAKIIAYVDQLISAHGASKLDVTTCLPGDGWSRPPFEPIMRACVNIYSKGKATGIATLVFGLIVRMRLERHPDVWHCTPRDEPNHERIYFKAG